MTHIHWFHPFALIAAWGMANLSLLIYRSKGDLAAFIAAINTLGEQPTAIIVILIGCVMLVECKMYGLDSTIAGGIIGIGGNMLQNKLKAAVVADPNADTTTTISTTTTPKP